MSDQPEKPDKLIDRMKQMPLWQWGGCFIFGAVFANLATQLMIDAGDLRRSEERAAQMGAAVAGGLLLLVGIGLIVAHFVRRGKK